MKKCFKCGEVKPLTAFYKHPQMADGHLGKCKECTKRDVRKNRNDNIEYYKKYDVDRGRLPHRVAARLAYSKTESGKAAATRSRKKSYAKYPEKRSATNAVNNAVRDGRLKKLPCEVCGSTTRIHGHHDDYSRPLEVRWLCHTHHMEVHRKMRENHEH